VVVENIIGWNAIGFSMDPASSDWVGLVTLCNVWPNVSVASHSVGCPDQQASARAQTIGARQQSPTPAQQQVHRCGPASRGL
jgi:hypothetical protein